MLYSRTWLLICFMYSSLCLIPNPDLSRPSRFTLWEVCFLCTISKKWSILSFTECLLCTKLSARVLTSATSLNLYSIQERNVVACQFCSWKDRLRVWRMGACFTNSEKLLICASLCQHHLCSQCCLCLF